MEASGLRSCNTSPKPLKDWSTFDILRCLSQIKLQEIFKSCNFCFISARNSISPKLLSTRYACKVVVESKGLSLPVPTVNMLPAMFNCLPASSADWAASEAGSLKISLVRLDNNKVSPLTEPFSGIKPAYASLLSQGK